MFYTTKQKQICIKPLRIRNHQDDYWAVDIEFIQYSAEVVLQMLNEDKQLPHSLWIECDITNETRNDLIATLDCYITAYNRKINTAYYGFLAQR